MWQLQKGVSSARSDDTKSLKGPILDWITPRGQCLDPPLARNLKIDRGFHHERTGALLCPTGLDWSKPEYAHVTSAMPCTDVKQDSSEASKWGDDGSRRPLAYFSLCRLRLRCE